MCNCLACVRCSFYIVLCVVLLACLMGSVFSICACVMCSFCLACVMCSFVGLCYVWFSGSVMCIFVGLCYV